MRAQRSTLPRAPEGTRWSLRQHRDAVDLRLQTRGLRRRTLAQCSTESFSTLPPDPHTALLDAATQLADQSEYLVTA